MILVAGGTGRLGKEIVRLLVARGEQVRVFARNAVEGIDVVAGDVRDRDAVARATVGVKTVVSSMHGFTSDPRGIDLDGNTNLLSAAKSNGVEHFVMLSVHGAAVDHGIELFRMKYLAERQLVSSPLAWTIIRPTAYMETWLSLLGAPLLEKGATTIFGRGANPINFVSVRDVARFVELAVVDPAMRGQILEVGGPENLTFSQFVDTLENVLGVSGKRRHVPLPMMRVMSWIMRVFNASLARQIRAGVIMDTQDLAFTTPHLPSIPPTTLAEAIVASEGLFRIANPR